METIVQPAASRGHCDGADHCADLAREANTMPGLAAGSTPLLYYELIVMKLDCRNVTTFNLGEYAWLATIVACGRSRLNPGGRWCLTFGRHQQEWVEINFETSRVQES